MSTRIYTHTRALPVLLLSPMDDLAHRKRKQDNDDRQDSAAADVAERRTTADSTPAPSSNAPRRPRLAETTGEAMWTSPSSPQVSSPLSAAPVVLNNASSTKRPRIDTQDATLRKRPLPRRASPINTPLTAVRQGSDIEDIGIVSTADPGPSSGSLLRERGPHSLDQRGLTLLQCPVDLSSPHIPSMKPLINRSTLKELELDIILRNPVIRAWRALSLLPQFSNYICFRPRLIIRPRAPIPTATQAGDDRKILERRLGGDSDWLYLRDS